MYNKSWTRHSDTDVAVDKILDAAGQTFADLGVAKAKMVDVAREAGCSRGTLYHYFPNQQALHLAFVHRATMRIARMIAQRVADAEGAGPSLTLADRIANGIAAVRADPMLAVWFEPENMAVPIALSQNSDLLRAVAVEPFGQVDATAEVRDEIARRGEWMLRSIVSLLAMPGTDPEAERAMIESFLVPVVTAEIPTIEVSR